MLSILVLLSYKNYENKMKHKILKHICFKFLSQRACLLQYNARRSGTAGTYAVALTLEDFPVGTTDFNSTTPFSAVGLQFLVIISARSGSCADVPLFTKATPTDGECTEVQIGLAYRAVIEVTLQDPSRR